MLGCELSMGTLMRLSLLDKLLIMLKHGGRDVQEVGNCKVVRCKLIRKGKNYPQVQQVFSK